MTTNDGVLRMRGDSRIAAAGTVDSWTRLDLERDGRICIEASAGTGKTWTIAALYLRLVLERGLVPRQIVVTTFTESAAQELRERLRAALLLAEHEAAGAAAAAATTYDPESYEAWLHARWLDGETARVKDLGKLRLALSQLDIAPIGTLHGLCRRILADHPFASGTEFVLPELVAGEAVLDEIVNDLWRIVRQGSDDAATKTLIESGIAGDLATLRRAVKQLLSPGIEIAPPLLDAQIHDAALWAKHLHEILVTKNLLAGSGDGPRLRQAWSALAAWLDGKAPAPCDHTHALKLARRDKAFLKDGRHSEAVKLAVRFTLEQAMPVLENLRLAGLAALTDLARTRLEASLARRNQLRFDDLLLRVRKALSIDAGDMSRRLADALHASWPVALIDEFQDTDAVQFGILDAIYRDARGAQRGVLVMIGDPKQAIYRFRGGDIDAYREAVGQAGQKLALRVNRRSARSLVAATNEFYAVGGVSMSATAAAAIEYIPVEASARCDDVPYRIAGSPVRKPLVIRYADAAPPRAGARRTAALTQCANQIADMLQSVEHTIGDRRITPADVAVLLPTSKSIRELRDLLRARRVPCATSDATSVFRTDTARELNIVLHAVANAGDLGALRAAAATRFWGATFADLQRYGDDLAQWQTVANRFHAWHGVWSDRGVLAVIERLLDHMAIRYLATPIGERTITDLRHLGELLQDQNDIVAGKEELLAWLARQRTDAAGDDSSEAADAAQLRIESDGDRVRIMTLHLSKGLEFPIVFVPLMWDHGQHPSQARANLFVMHADGNRRIAVTDAAKEQELHDLQDERFRVLYVALTRAIHACHVYAQPVEKVKGGTQRSAFDEIVHRMAPPIVDGNGVSVSRALRDATPHVDWIDGWTFSDTPPLQQRSVDTSVARVARRAPASRVGALEAKHSFTTLTQFAHAGLESDTPAADEVDIDADVDADMDIGGLREEVAEEIAVAAAHALAAEAHPEILRLARVRGADFGNAVHAVLEEREVGRPLVEQHELILRCLDEAGVRRRDLETVTFVEALSRRLDAALAAPLGLAAAPRLSLRDLPARSLRAEMEFHFAIDSVAMQRLRQCCADHGEPELVPRSHRVLSGLMTGKIDLVFQHEGRFHVLDYKGNYLGDYAADYTGPALSAAMDASYYRFQALIYTVAVDRYLRQRLGSAYGRRANLGECIYFFLRAAGLAQGAGIWRHRFDDALLEAVDEVLSASQEVAA